MLAARTYSITELGQQSGFDRRTIVYYIQQGLLPKAGRRGPNTRYPEEVLLRLQFVRGVKTLQDEGRSGTITLAQVRAMLGRVDGAALRELLDGGLQPDALEPLLAAAAAEPPATDAGTMAHSPAAAASATPPAQPAAPAGGGGGASLFSRQAPARPTVGDGRSYGLADAGIRKRFGTPSAAPEGAAPAPALPGTRDGGQPPPPATPAEEAGSVAISAESAAIHADLGQLLRELEIRPAMQARRLAPGSAEQWTEIPITGRVYLSVRGLSEADAPLAEAVARGLKKLLRAR